MQSVSYDLSRKLSQIAYHAQNVNDSQAKDSDDGYAPMLYLVPPSLLDQAINLLHKVLDYAMALDIYPIRG